MWFEWGAKLQPRRVNGNLKFGEILQKSSQYCAFICEKKRLNWTILFFGLGRVKHQKALKWRGLGGNNGTASPFAFARISIRLLCVAEQRNEIRFRKSADVSLERNCHLTHHMGDEKGTRSNCYLHVITLQHMTCDWHLRLLIVKSICFTKCLVSD